MKLEEITNQKNEELFAELEKEKNNLDMANNLIDEINKRLQNKKIAFTKQYSKFIYLYMYLSNKLNKIEILNKLINDEDFIKLLDETDIDGSIILSLTQKCLKPRKILVSKSKKLKISLLNGDNILNAIDFLDDLTKEEIIIFRKDIKIDNYLITNGLCFDTIKEETKKQLLSDLNLLSIYNIKTLVDFSQNFEAPTFLIEDPTFLNMYLNKLQKDYSIENYVFKFIDEKTLKYILKNFYKDNILLYLVKDTNRKIQQNLLNDKHIKELLEQCENIDILKKLPNTYIKNILATSSNLFNKINIILLEKLSPKDISYVLNQNPKYYQNLINNIHNGNLNNLELFIDNMPSKYIDDLIKKQLSTFSTESLISLLKINPKLFKKAILNDKEICTRLLNDTEYELLENIFENGKFTNEDKTNLIKKSEKYLKTSNLSKILPTIPKIYHKTLYENSSLRKVILNNSSIDIDEYMVSYLLNNIKELETASSEKIFEVLNNSDYYSVEKILSNSIILNNLLSNKESHQELINIIKKVPNIINIISNEKNYNILNKDFLSLANQKLSRQERKILCSNNLMKHIYTQEDIYKTYKNLSSKNNNLLKTLDLNFLNDDSIKIKESFLEKITKYPELQETILEINNNFKIVPDFINSIFYNLSQLSIDEINKCLNVIKDSVQGINRKKIGNIPKLMSAADDSIFSKENTNSLFEYLLYLIPRYNDKENELVKRPIYLETPLTYNDIKKYSEKTEEYLTIKINTKNDNLTKEYFIAKHFKLTLNEAEIILNKYSIDRIDNNIYPSEYEYLNNLKMVYNTDPESLKKMDEEYKVYKMYESFTIENSIKKMYGKIFNYEIRSKTYSNKPFTKTIYGKEIKIFECPNDFLFLISNLNIDNEYQNINSYFEAWHNTLDNINEGIKTNLISNDHFILKDDFAFGFNGLLDEGLIKMSNYDICPRCCNLSREKYMTPRELIDNSRDEYNTIIISKYAIRPNFNNSNYPYLEPDYILVDKNKLDDNTYLEKVSRASQEFKNKRNKDGLPIIAYDLTKIVDNEIKKISQLQKKYQRTHDMNIIPSLLSKIINNYSAYITYDKYTAEKFNPNKFINIIKERISTSNSQSELTYIEDTIINEFVKFKNISKDIAFDFNIKEIKKIIKDRIEVINNM